jgi:translation initiation factor IF-1
MFYKNKESSYDFNEDIEEYAFVINTLGNCRVTVITNTSIKAIGIIRGSLRNYKNRVLIEKGNIVIVTKNNETADKKVYIVHKLNPEQINSLIKEQKLSETIINYYNGIHSVNINENEINSINDASLVFI